MRHARGDDRTGQRPTVRTAHTCGVCAHGVCPRRAQLEQTERRLRTNISALEEQPPVSPGGAEEDAVLGAVGLLQDVSNLDRALLPPGVQNAKA